MSAELVRIATVGSAHGLRGEARVSLHTDDPGSRLAPGAELVTEPAGAGPLTVISLAERGGAWYVRFAGHPDRTAVEALRGVVLLAEPVTEEDAWYPGELHGLSARRSTGEEIGTIEGLEHYPAQDVLVLREPDGARTLVPFVREIVPEVDVPGGRIVIDPPAGLLAAEAGEEAQR